MKNRSVFILNNTLKSGGAEKQSIFLANELSSYFYVRLIVYHGNQYDKRMLSLIDGQDVKVILLKKGHLNRLLYLYKLFRHNKDGIVISYLATTNVLNAIIGKLAGVRIRIGGIRNSKLKPWKRIIERLIHNHLLTCTIYNNKKGLNDLLDKGFSKIKSLVIHNGIYIGQSPKKQINSDTFTLLTVSRFVEQKDYKTAIIAFEKIVRHYRKIRYIIVGYGPLEAELREVIQILNITDHIELVINPSNVDAYYEQADIYLSTSLFEGLSNSIMEAMSYSLPIIATDVGDNNQLVIQGETGFLVNVKDVDTIADRISTLIEDQNLRLSMGEKAYKHISENFSMDAFIKKYLTLFERLINETES